MSLNYKLIGQRIKEYRMQNGISQSELAEQTDMSVSYISHIETARKQASLESLVKIVDVLGITVNHVLRGNQKNNQSGYQMELLQLLEGCNKYESRIIYEIAAAAKKSLRDNEWLQCKDDHHL